MENTRPDKYIVLYLCDGRASCRNSYGCSLNDSATVYSETCMHTSKPEYAYYPLCEDPWNHPERFKREESSDGTVYFTEVIE